MVGLLGWLNGWLVEVVEGLAYWGGRMVGLLGWQGGWIATRVGRIDPDGTQLIYIYILL